MKQNMMRYKIWTLLVAMLFCVTTAKAADNGTVMIKEASTDALTNATVKVNGNAVAVNGTTTATGTVTLTVDPAGEYLMTGATVSIKTYTTVPAQTRTDAPSYVGSIVATPDASVKGKYTFTMPANSLNVEVTIGVTTAEVTLTGVPATYTGSAITPGVKIGSETGTATNCNITYSNNTNAALATDASAPTVTITGQGAYWGTATKKFTIKKAELSTVIFNANEQSFDYDVNTPHHPGIQSVLTANGIAVPSSDYTLSGDTEKTDANSYNSTTASYDTYTLTVTAKENTNFTGSVNANWSISQADLNIKSRFKVSVGGTVYATTEQYSTEYSASAQTPAIVITDNNVTNPEDDPTVPASNYDLSWINNTNCGTATVTITAKGANYAGVRTETFQITKATIELSPAAHTITYGDAPSTSSVTYSQFNGADFDNSVVTGAPTLTTTYTQYGDPGSYPITITVDGNNEVSGMSANNFKFVVAEGSATNKLTVNPRELGLDWSNSVFTYDGAEHAPTPTITGVLNSDDVTVTVDKQINAGSYTATASLGGGKVACYKLPTDNTMAYIIEKASMSVTSSAPNDVTYDKAAHGITVTVTAPADGYTITYSDTETGTYSADGNQKTDAGTYTIYYKVTADNYEDATGSGTFTIKKATISSVAATGVTAPVTGQNLDTEAACSTEGVKTTTLSWRIGDTAATGIAGSGKTYTADVVLTADPNYEFATEVSGTIDDQTATATLLSNGNLRLSRNYDATTTAYPTADMFVVTLPDALEYNGSPKTATVTYAEGYGEAGVGIPTVKYYDSNGALVTFHDETENVDIDGATNAGTYTVKLNVSEGAGYSAINDLTKDGWTFTITPTNYTLDGTAVATAAYGTATNAIAISGLTVKNVAGDEVAGSWAFSATDTEILSVGNTTEKTATFTPTTPDANYNTLTYGIIPVIEPKDISSTMTIEVSSTMIGEEPTVTVKDGATTLVKGTDYIVTYKNSAGGTVTELTAIGDYTAVITPVENGNYTFTEQQKTFKVKDRPTADMFSVTPPTDLVYSGEAKVATASATAAYVGKVGTPTVKYYWGDEAVTSAINAGTYTIKLDVAEGTDYCAATGLTKDAWAFTITTNNTAPTVTVSDITAGQTPSVTVKVGNTTLKEGTDYTIAYKNSAGETVTSLTEAGTYTVVITPKAGGNYGFTAVEKTFTVSPSSGEVVTIPDSNSGTNMTATVTGSKTDESTGKTVYELTLNSLPASVLNGTTSLNGNDMTVEQNGKTYQVTKVDTKAFNDQAEGAIIFLPAGVSTTGAVTNVVNGDGTATELNLNKVTSFNAPREIKADKVTYQRKESEAYFTLCLPYGFELPEGYTSWTLERGVNGVAEFSHSRKSLKAYEPYVIEATTKTGTRGSDDVLDLSATNVTIAATGSDKSVLKDDVEMFGTVTGLTLPKGDELEAYVMEEDANWRMKPLTSSLYVPAFECYLVVKWGRDTFPSQFGEATGIWGIEGDASDTGAWYDLNGRKLDGKPKTKGLYIYNGVKVVIK